MTPATCHPSRAELIDFFVSHYGFTSYETLAQHARHICEVKLKTHNVQVSSTIGYGYFAFLPLDSVTDSGNSVIDSVIDSITDVVYPPFLMYL